MKIEKNIPIKGVWGKYLSLVAKMEEGDSVLCKNEKEAKTIRRTIYLKCNGYKPLQRTQEDGTIRVWKVKKEEKGDEKN